MGLNMFDKMNSLVMELGGQSKVVMMKMLDSKKAAALIVSGILMLMVYTLGPLEDNLKMDFADKLMKVVIVYLGAQGAADFGKEKAKLEKPEKVVVEKEKEGE